MGWFGKNSGGEGIEGEERGEREAARRPAEPIPDAVEAPFAHVMAAPATPATPAPPADPPARQGVARAPFPDPPAPRPEPMPANPASASVFSESVDIEGSIEGQGDVVLRGKVRGSVNITGCLIVGQAGTVQADVSAREVVNAGTVEGNINAAQRVRVQATGVVQGDIDSPSIIIDDGGGVEGFVHMAPPGGEDATEDDEEFVPPPLLRVEKGARTGLPAAARFARSAAETVPRLEGLPAAFEDASGPAVGRGGDDTRDPSLSDAALALPPAGSAGPARSPGAGAPPEPLPASGGEGAAARASLPAASPALRPRTLERASGAPPASGPADADATWVLPQGPPKT